MDCATSIWWTGPICGLGNRLIALAAVKACAGNRIVNFPWRNEPACPGDYDDIFEVMPGLAPTSGPDPDFSPPAGAVVISTGWEPIEIYEQFRAALSLDLTLEKFCKALVHELRGIAFKSVLTEDAKQWRTLASQGALAGVHIRRTDRSAQHRQQFRDFLARKSGLSRELPIYLSALYGISPPQFMQRWENAALALSLGRFARTSGRFDFAIFSDDANATLAFKNAAKFYRVCGAAVDTEPGRMNSGGGIRRTELKDAVVDLLRLAQCDAIVQSNRASTFSLVAAIYGAKPIISAKTMYPFWNIIEASTGMEPNDRRLA